MGTGSSNDKKKANDIKKQKKELKSPVKVQEEHETEKKPKDFLQFIDKNMKVEELKLTVSQLIENCLVSLKVFVNRMQCLNVKTQVSSIFLNRFEQIELKIIELQEISQDVSREGIENMIEIIEKMKIYTENLMRSPQNIYSQANKFIFSNYHSKELMIFDEDLTKIYDDFKIPFSLKDLTLQKESIKSLNEKSAKIAEILTNLEGNGANTLEILKSALTNEEAFIFWLEYFPDKYLVQKEEIMIAFRDYISGYKGIELKKTSIDLIITLINDSFEENDENLDNINNITFDANQVNVFFQSLPFDLKWNKLDEFKEKFDEIKRNRIDEIKTLRKNEDEKNKEIMEFILNKETIEEKDLINNANYSRFIARQSSYISKADKKSEIQIRNIFIMTENGNLEVFCKEIAMEFKLSGKLELDGQFILYRKNHKSNKNIEYRGKIQTFLNEKLIFLGNSLEETLYIELDVDKWLGYYSKGEYFSDLTVYLKISAESINGICIDEMGVSIWRSVFQIPLNMNLIRVYISKHSVNYEINIKQKQITTEINGIYENSCVLLLSHRDEIHS